VNVWERSSGSRSEFRRVSFERQECLHCVTWNVVQLIVRGAWFCECLGETRGL